MPASFWHGQAVREALSLVFERLAKDPEWYMWNQSLFHCFQVLFLVLWKLVFVLASQPSDAWGATSGCVWGGEGDHVMLEMVPGSPARKAWCSAHWAVCLSGPWGYVLAPKSNLVQRSVESQYSRQDRNRIHISGNEQNSSRTAAYMQLAGQFLGHRCDLIFFYFKLGGHTWQAQGVYCSWLSAHELHLIGTQETYVGLGPNWGQPHIQDKHLNPCTRFLAPDEL